MREEREPYFPAQRDDVWYRWLLKKGEIPTNDADKIKYWETAFKEPAEPRRWARECSGRILRLARSITQDAERRAAEQNARRTKRDLAFRGLYYGLADRLATTPPAAFDVWIEPIEVDPAHANLTALSAEDFDETGKLTPFAILDHLASSLKYAEPDSPELREMEGH